MQLRLRAPTLDFYVDVRLRDFGSCWMAVADLAGDSELGFGLTAREALRSALASLGPVADELIAAGLDRADD